MRLSNYIAILYNKMQQILFVWNGDTKKTHSKNCYSLKYSPNSHDSQRWARLNSIHILTGAETQFPESAPTVSSAEQGQASNSHSEKCRHCNCQMPHTIFLKKIYKKVERINLFKLTRNYMLNYISVAFTGLLTSRNRGLKKWDLKQE